MDAVDKLLSSAADRLDRAVDFLNCRLMPHGGPPVLLPAVLSTLGLCSSLAEDGCDYARVRGAAAELLTGSSAVPFVDAGLAGRRVPGFYPAENVWRVALFGDGAGCVPYPREEWDALADVPWIAAERLRFLGLVAGGTATMFLWTVTCLAVRPWHWRAVGITVALACCFQACSFVWFSTEFCRTSATNLEDFMRARYREVETGDSQHAEEAGSSCALFFGSNCIIASCVLYAAASTVMLLRGYPEPGPRLVVREEAKDVRIFANKGRTGRRKHRSDLSTISTKTGGTRYAHSAESATSVLPSDQTAARFYRSAELAASVSTAQTPASFCRREELAASVLTAQTPARFYRSDELCQSEELAASVLTAQTPARFYRSDELTASVSTGRTPARFYRSADLASSLSSAKMHQESRSLPRNASMRPSGEGVSVVGNASWHRSAMGRRASDVSEITYV